MHDAVTELKIRAEILQKQLKANEPAAFARLRALPEFKRKNEAELAAAAANLRHRDCLEAVSAEWGFPGYAEAKAALAGDAPVEDFGTLLYPRGKGPSLNRWYAHYDDAARDREICAGYLVGYKRQFLVVERDYIESLGLDPDDDDWTAIGFDWAHPADTAARTRLYDKLGGGAVGGGYHARA